MANIQIVIFKIGSESFGISIEEVLEIVSPQQVFKVPETSDFIEGISNIRNVVYLLVNLRKKFGLPSKEYDENTKFIVSNYKSSPVGFIVDQVNEVVWIDDSVIDRTPEKLTEHKNKSVTGIVKLEKGTILIFDMNRFMEGIGK
jgi:purine-binding chemotaxis protein CheW